MTIGIYVCRECSHNALTVHMLQKINHRYVPPEVALGAEYEKSSDVYSFGILLYEIFTLNIPYSKAGFPDITVKTKKFIERLDKGERRVCVPVRQYVPALRSANSNTQTPSPPYGFQKTHKV